jgi:hypothetical protein
MREKHNEPEFVVTDRRKFTESGELRPDSESEQTPAEQKAPLGKEAKEAKESRAQEASAPAEQSPAAEAGKTARVEHLREAPPVTQAEHEAQGREYDEGNKRLDDILREKTGGKTQSLEMTFERLVASLYMTAMLQLGLMAPEGEQPRADILGARQTIDTIGILNDKTKGNLNPAEQNLLQQSLFDLRMAYLELTNAITRAGQAGDKGAPGSGFGPIAGAKK